jgi:hypothetical protein
MSMENNIKEFIEGLIHEVEKDLDETTATGNVAGYQTPNAFSDKGKSDKKRKKKIATALGYSVVDGDVDNISEAIKGRNNKTGESFGMVIGSDKKNREGDFEVTIRKTYSSRISAYGFVFDKDSNLISIKDYGYSMDGKFPDMKGSSSVSSVRPNKRETIAQIAKITSPAFAKKIYQHVQKNNKMDESVNEANSRDEYDAKEFWGDSKIGIQLHKQFKGRFNKSKFQKALSDLIGKSKRPESTIKIIGRYLNLPLRQLNSYTSGEIIEDQEFIKDSTKKAEQLYKIFVSLKESVNEGKKRFKRQDGIGKAKYTISYHDGKKKHKDGSDFFDIKIFKNKKDLSDFVGTLAKQGYKLTNESVNEDRNSNMFYVLYQKKGVLGKPAAAGYKDRKDAEKFAKSLGSNHNTMILDKQSMKNVKGVDVNEASKLAMGIAGFTGTRGSAVDAFIDSHKIDAKKLFNFVKKGNLKDRMAFVSAIAGRPNNKMFKMITKQFGESVNEAKVKRPVNRWLELKNDDSMHAHKKMAMGLKELKYQLRETEKFFNWYNKIKTMNELDSNQYWKRTNSHIYKIKERLINIARTIQEIEK